MLVRYTQEEQEEKGKMAETEFKYRGKTLAELKQMDISQFIKLLTSRKRRSLSRSAMQKAQPLLKKIRQMNQGSRKKPIKTQLRTMVVIPEMVGHTIGIHNGREYISMKITDEMIGLYFGELSQTRKKVVHGAAGIGATKSSTASASKAK